jgi:hypothetical protein
MNMNNLNMLENGNKSLQLNTVSTVKKAKYVELNFELDKFYDFTVFSDKFLSVLHLDLEYTILARVSYKKVGEDVFIIEHKMLGEQVGFSESNYKNLTDFILKYYEGINSRLEISMDNYNYMGFEILAVQFIVYTIGEESKIRLQKFKKSQLGEHKDLINVSKVTKQFNNYLPLTFDVSKFGFLLNKHVENGFVKSITLLDGTILDFVNLINKYLLPTKQIKYLGSGVDFYQSKIEKNDVILMVKSSGSVNTISIYSLNGIFISTIEDQRINSLAFTRSIGNVKSYIDNTGIQKRAICIKFPYVYTYPYKGRYSRLYQPDWKIGTLDLETYMVDGNLAKTYAIGFYTKNDMKTFYINSELDSDSLIMQCINSMLKEKYNGYTFYVHNLGNYDIYFILPVLYKYSELYPDTYRIQPILRDDDVISISISTMKQADSSNNLAGSRKNITITISDSYTLLQSSLEDLCETFNPEVKKSYFPYKFVNQNTLFYVGDKPNIKYYLKADKSKFDLEANRDISIKESTINTNVYNSIPTDNWSMEEQTIIYLEKDLLSLYSVIEGFRDVIYIKYHTHITKSLTISSLSLDIFLRRYYSNNIPLIKQKSIYNNIKKSYYGGITEVYKPYGKDLFHYDVNSLYPHASLNPMPGLNCTFTDNINKNIMDLSDIFGFFYCKVTTNNQYLGLLPYRENDGLILPQGVFGGWYFSEEVKFASQHGYTIEVIEGYQFDRTTDIFTKYIKELYEVKSTTTDKVRKSLAKSMLNNLLGRFGLDINKFETRVVSKEEFEYILQTRNVRSVKNVNNKVLVSYSKDISESVCDSHNLDYRKIIVDKLFANTKFNSLKDPEYKDVSVAISSCVTAYARIFMNKIKLDILSKGGIIYYTDTDSIVTNIRLDEMLVGTELGQFKLEHEIEEAYYISNKTYGFKTTDGKYIIKNKGIYKKSLNYNSFKDLYLGNGVEAFRFESKKDFSRGSVVINTTKKITISPTSYTKRLKVMDKGVWIDTKPITLSLGKSNQYHTLIPCKYKDKWTLFKKYWKVIVRFTKQFLILFLFFLCLIGYIASFDVDEDNTFDSWELEENTTEIGGDLTIVDVEVTNNSNLEYPGFLGKIKQEWFYFVDLFSKDKVNNIIFIHNTDLGTKSLGTNEQLDKAEIFRAIVDTQLISNNEEIEKLRDRVSLLEIDLQRSRLDKLNSDSIIDSILQDLKIAKVNASSIQTLNNSPHLNITPHLIQAPFFGSSPVTPINTNSSTFR